VTSRSRIPYAPRMRVAVLCDIHGNDAALAAVLDALVHERPDRIVVGGDVAFGPEPVAVLERLAALGDRAVYLRGNADRELGPGATVTSQPWGAQQRWVQERLPDRWRHFLAELPATLAIDIDGLGPVRFCHGTPRSEDVIVTRVTSDARAERLYAGTSESVVVGGHTHVQFDRMLAGRRVINAGSVGMPYEQRSGAYWTWLGPGVTLRRTEYDVAATAALIRAGGFPGGDALAGMLLAPPDPQAMSERFEQQALAGESAAG
jgi:predicted phosphodiesterase